MKKRKAVEISTQDMGAMDDDFNSSEEARYGSTEEESEPGEIDELRDNDVISYFAAQACPNDTYHDAVSAFACDLPKEQPMSNQGIMFHELKQLDTSNDEMKLNDNDRFCDAAENEFNTSMAVFYYCLRNGYLK